MVARREKVIITCAVTGSVHTPTMSPHLPATSDQIAQSAIEAAEAGAAIVHLHARHPDGRPAHSADAFMEFLPRIKQSTRAVVNITTGGAPGMTVEQRLEAALRAKPEMTSLNMGSMNFALFPLAERYDTWQHDWEKPYLEGTKDYVFKSTFKDIEYTMETLGKGHGVRFEFECYDIGHLYSLAYFVDKGLVKPPFFIQTIFGILGGMGAHIENLNHMKLIADKLFGSNYHWSILAAGRHQMNFLTHGALQGSHVRVGLEDSLMLGRGQLAPSNAAQVTKIRRILEELSLEIATPDEARAMLGLKGGDAVGF